jgi:plasmid stabilization system protein ParE
MAGRVIWHRLAEENLTEAYLYIGADSPDAAERLLDAVEQALQFLLENPGAGRLRDFRSPRAQGVRSWVVKGFQSYLIYYRPAGDDLVRFLHGARDLPRLLEDET